VKIEGNSVRFTPPKNRPAYSTVTLGYAVRDACGATASAAVTVRRN
jgi:hypothetical protein